jgi:hypothetical protein
VRGDAARRNGSAEWLGGMARRKDRQMNKPLGEFAFDFHVRGAIRRHRDSERITGFAWA